MSKLTVKDYANKYQVTRQTIYNKIKKGLLKTVEENGILFVIDDIIDISNDIKIVSKNDSRDDCSKLVKKLIKRIEKLENKLDKERDKNNQMIFSYVEEMKSLYLPTPKNQKKSKKKKDKK